MEEILVKKNRFFWRKAVSVISGGAAMMAVWASAASSAQAAGFYACYRPASAAHNKYVSFPKGDWRPWHNTNNWSYKAVPGRDYYQKNSDSSKRVNIVCNPAWHPFPVPLLVDADGNQDWCGREVPAKPALEYTPSCFFSGATYDYSKGACFNSAGNYWVGGRNESIVPFGVDQVLFGYNQNGANQYHKYCPNGGNFRFRETSPISVKNAQKLPDLNGRNLSCPAGEKYRVQIKTTLQDGPDPEIASWGNRTGHFIFTVPANASKAFFSASVKPGGHAARITYSPLLFGISDRETISSGNSWYYPSSGGAKDIGRTYRSLESPTVNKAIFQDRWDVEVVPDFVHFGIPINQIVNSGGGSTTKIVAHFKRTRGSKPMTIVKKGKLEYCAPLEITGSGTSQISNPLPAGPSGTTGPAPKPDVSVVPPRPSKPVWRCRKGEKAFTSRKNIPRGWLVRPTVQHGRKVWCAKPPTVKKLRCDRGQKQVRPGTRPPYGWLLLRKRRGKQVVWCLKRDPDARPPRCAKGERLFTNIRKVPRGWKKRLIRKGRYTFYCAKPARKECRKGYVLVRNKCVRKVIIQLPKPGQLIPGLSPRGEPRKHEPRQIKCPHGTRPYKGRCVKG